MNDTRKDYILFFIVMTIVGFIFSYSALAGDLDNGCTYGYVHMPDGRVLMCSYCPAGTTCQ